MIYAILNLENICISVAKYNQELIEVPANFITVEDGQDVQWHKYENGTWSTETYEPEQDEPMPTSEEIQAQILLNTEYLVILSEISNL